MEPVTNVASEPSAQAVAKDASERYVTYAETVDTAQLASRYFVQ